MMEEHLPTRVQRYLRGELPAEEQVALEALLKRSPEAREELALSRRLHQVIREEYSPHPRPSTPPRPVRNHLALPSPSTVGPLGSRVFWLSFIGLGIVLMLSSVYFWSRSIDRTASVDAAYLEPLEMDLPFMVDPAEEGPLNRAIQAYRVADYKSATSGFNQYLQSHRDINARLYLSVAQLMVGQNEAALSNLKVVLGQSKGSVRAASQWYLALAELQTGQQIEARLLLKNLRADDVYGIRAQELLAELDRDL
ncbi:MAG: hypothetical protein AAFR05_21905 [Bacteroidota bacterium]